ncbi:MAG: response regulator [Balneola sp.]|nr:MAG: response regulator [Balneola sp.]
MSQQIYILVIEDELEVLDALVLDLEEFEEVFPLETANTTREAREVISEIYDSGNVIGLILCDHILPGENGVDLLIELQAHDVYRKSKKVLVTGQAGLEDTIQAINKASLNHYIAKPWTKKGLSETVVKQLTDFVIQQGYNPLKYMSLLDTERLSEHLRGNQPTDH